MLPETSTEIHKHPTHGLVACQNCAHEFEGNFCNQCGQTSHTHAIDWHYLWHEIPHSVWHVDRGILFSLRELCTRPGYTIRDFIQGKRVNHYRPLALLLFLGAIITFASHSLDVNLSKSSQQMFAPTNADAPARQNDFQTQMFQFLEEKPAVAQIIMLPFFAFGFWRMFRRKGYSYPQLLVEQTFITNFFMLVSLVITLLFWLLGGTAIAFKSIMAFSIVAFIGYTVLTNLQLFRDKLSAKAIVVRSIAGYALGYLSFILLVSVIGLGAGIYLGYQEAHSPKKAPAPTHTAAPSHH